MLDSLNHPVIWYVIGVLSAIIIYLAWNWLRLIIANRSLRSEEDLLTHKTTSPSEQQKQALRQIKTCQKRLFLQRKVNPDWIEPLKTELPRLVEEIARTYYPKADNPVLAPGISEFARAIELFANDIASFLQDTKPGRLIDTSAHTARRTYEVTKSIIKDSRFKETLKWYKHVRPVIQIAKISSPIMWVSLLTKNLAGRIGQVTIIGLAGKWSIELYSGNLRQQKTERRNSSASAPEK
jgi:hypothetical protein